MKIYKYVCNFFEKQYKISFKQRTRIHVIKRTSEIGVAPRFKRFRLLYLCWAGLGMGGAEYTPQTVITTKAHAVLENKKSNKSIGMYLHLMNEYENLNERTRHIQRAKERLIGRRKMLEVVLFTPQWKHSSTIWRLIGNILYFLFCAKNLLLSPLSHIVLCALPKQSVAVSAVLKYIN